ncbi:cactin isoform X2 [Nilaparvata lugens]|uniref:cactin isoform X2 n=1 Tax=Nilaparvata lugens TaxID=108931 RepID=UPI00193C9B87|nr:cactin isoform X2 [Nilaparvata lugens]
MVISCAAYNCTEIFRKKSGTSSHAASSSRHSTHKKKKRSSRKESDSDDSSSDDRRTRKPDKSTSRSKKSKHRRRERSSSKDSHKKKQKHTKKRRSSTEDSDCSTSSDDSIKLLQKLKEERERAMKERKLQKELMKANETPEEKRLRRLMKKEQKERKRKERMGWDNDYLHYTNTDNPFGDGNLLATFVWSKKLDKEGLSGVSREELEVRNRQKQEENRRELEKVKKRRLERELERQQREEEMAMMQRSKEAAQFQEWERQEDQFHLEQARLRSCIRIQDGRAKPIDLLAKYISAEEEVDAVEMHEPYTYLNGLHIKDLEDLIEDIKVYMELEKGKNLDYWNDITVIVEDELHKLRKQEKQSDYEAAVGRREGIHECVAQEVSSVFKGKTAAHLQALQAQIEKKITNQTQGVDIGYWESLLSQLKAHMARARLRDRHQDNLRRKLEVLKAEQGVEEVKQEVCSSSSDEAESSRGSDRATKDDDIEASMQVKQEADEDDEQGGGSEIEDEEQAACTMLNESFAEYSSGAYSPTYLAQWQLEPGTILTTPEDDDKRLDFARRLQVGGRGGAGGSGGAGAEESSGGEAALQREARKGMTADEAEFSVESALDSHVYLWSDKYRPRKPRYFNRVHTGFEWNKYNQTHYDMDNPPPKIVQGYKFNIFYPDLIDKNATPEYFLTACPDNHDFAILRFHAGPPYEDIAFKIVNREWEYSYKRGFRCQFHNNIFQLWFHFKRYRYRR